LKKTEVWLEALGQALAVPNTSGKLQGLFRGLIGLLEVRKGPKGSKVSKDCGTFHAQSLSFNKYTFILESLYILLKVIKDPVKSFVKY
jgi:hypothetical protein